MPVMDYFPAEHKCQKCCYQTFSNSTYCTHCDIHDKEPEVGLLSCKICKQKNQNVDAFLAHMACHTSGKPVRLYSCQYCGAGNFVSNDMDAIEEHVEKIHPEEDGEFKTLKYTIGNGNCPWCKWKCQELSKNGKELYVHILSIHGQTTADAFMLESPISYVPIPLDSYKEIGTIAPLAVAKAEPKTEPIATEHTHEPPVEIPNLPILKSSCPSSPEAAISSSTSKSPGPSAAPKLPMLSTSGSPIAKSPKTPEAPQSTPSPPQISPAPEINRDDPNSEEVESEDLEGCFLCSYCSFETHRQLLLKAHMQKHLEATVVGVAIYVCGTCYEWGSTSAEQVNVHSLQKHAVEQEEDISSVIDIKGK